MGRLLLPALAALSPWVTVFATEITSTFTTLVPTTAIVTSSSAIAGCTVASSMQIACSDGYYNVYGLMWQETCAASTSGGSLLLSSEGLSLRACAGGCAVRSSCTAVTWDSTNNMCYLWEGDVTVTSGGSYQAAIRHIDGRGGLYYFHPEFDPRGSDSFFHPGYSVLGLPTTIFAIFVLCGSVLSTHDSTLDHFFCPDRSFFAHFVWLLFYSLLSLLADFIFYCGTVVDSIDQTFDHFFCLNQFFFARSVWLLFYPLLSFFFFFFFFRPVRLFWSVCFSSEPGGHFGHNEWIITFDPTVTSCAAAITDCPANQQTTYLTTETITYVTTLCPEADRPTAQPAAATGSTTLPPTACFGGPITETGISSSHFITSTAYVTEIEVVTACPPSVDDCSVGQKSTYTMTKTVAAYMTTNLVAIADSAQASQSTGPVMHPVAVPDLSLAHSHAPNPTPSSDNAKYTLPHAQLSSLWKASPTSSGMTQTMHATTMNTVAGKSTSSVTTSAPGSLFTGDAPKMGQFTILFTVVAMLSSLLFAY
ncbi:uncharacterized protein N7503_010056 [Penicillium pulvis]|uniref:uncharacterized protein n=1 Tax=Penicillium pulvis TaxID=1562058 RepID=UPI00254906D8|nr:uncharacterized protein N7503_010056 [Penicillium pulvis]KAJ5784844.1 hypothetical protein N7503_010056 [Penicillium pulvis]